MLSKNTFRRLLGLGFLLLCSLWVFAENAPGEAVDPDYLANYLGKIFVICGFIIAFMVVLYMFRIFNLMIDVEKKKMMIEKGIFVESLQPKPKQKSLWAKVYEWSTQAVPIEKEMDVLLDHNYDGIRELDNSLPPWWLAMFYMSIVFAFIYFPYYHVFDKGLSSTEEYQVEMAWAARQQRLRLAQQANDVNENSVKVLNSENALASGEKIFIASCAACHGQKGEGGVGPNLTDNYWLHGGDIKSIFKTVKYGVPEKGMIAWKNQMSPVSMHEVASFITTLKGTTPPNAKAPEGELFDEKKDDRES